LQGLLSNNLTGALTGHCLVRRRRRRRKRRNYKEQNGIGIRK
jgi:hypothetical protein